MRLATAAGALGARSDYPALSTALAVEAADVSGDGRADLVVAAAANVAVLLGDGRGGFARPTFFAASDFSSALVVADFNADGLLDLATADMLYERVSILLQKVDDRVAPVVPRPACPRAVRHLRTFKVKGVLPGAPASYGTVLVRAYRYVRGAWRPYSKRTAVVAASAAGTAYSADYVCANIGRYRFKTTVVACTQWLSATSPYSRVLRVR